MTLQIRPNPDCKQCHGEGEVFDTVPYGSTVAHMPSFCHCVEEQIPEDYEDEISIFPGSKMNYKDIMNHSLHPHPKLEEKLGLDSKHVIVDLYAWSQIFENPI